MLFLLLLLMASLFPQCTPDQTYYPDWSSEDQPDQPDERKLAKYPISKYTLETANVLDVLKGLLWCLSNFEYLLIYEPILKEEKAINQAKYEMESVMTLMDTIHNKIPYMRRDDIKRFEWLRSVPFYLHHRFAGLVVSSMVRSHKSKLRRLSLFKNESSSRIAIESYAEKLLWTIGRFSHTLEAPAPVNVTDDSEKIYAKLTKWSIRDYLQCEGDTFYVRPSWRLNRIFINYNSDADPNKSNYPKEPPFNRSRMQQNRRRNSRFSFGSGSESEMSDSSIGSDTSQSSQRPKTIFSVFKTPSKKRLSLFSDIDDDDSTIPTTKTQLEKVKTELDIVKTELAIEKARVLDLNISSKSDNRREKSQIKELKERVSAFRELAQQLDTFVPRSSDAEYGYIVGDVIDHTEPLHRLHFHLKSGYYHKLHLKYKKLAQNNHLLIRKAKENSETLQANNMVMTDNLEKNRKVVTDLTESNTNLERSITLSQEKYKELERMHKLLKEEKVDLQSKKDHLADECERLQHDHSKMEQDLESKVASSDNDILRLEREISAHAEAAERYKALADANQAKFMSESAQTSDLRQKSYELEDTCKRLYTEIDALKTLNQDIDVNLQKERSILSEQQNREAAAAKKECSQTADMLETTQNKFDQQRNRMLLLETEAEELRTSNAMLRAKRKECELYQDELRSTIVQLQSKTMDSEHRRSQSSQDESYFRLFPRLSNLLRSDSDVPIHEVGHQTDDIISKLWEDGSKALSKDLTIVQEKVHTLYTEARKHYSNEPAPDEEPYMSLFVIDDNLIRNQLSEISAYIDAATSCVVRSSAVNRELPAKFQQYEGSQISYQPDNASLKRSIKMGREGSAGQPTLCSYPAWPGDDEEEVSTRASRVAGRRRAKYSLIPHEREGESYTDLSCDRTMITNALPTKEVRELDGEVNGAAIPFVQEHNEDQKEEGWPGLSASKPNFIGIGVMGFLGGCLGFIIVWIMYSILRKMCRPAEMDLIPNGLARSQTFQISH